MNVGIVVQAFLKKFRPDAFFALTYAAWCDKLRVGEFAGGALFVTAMSFEILMAGDWVDEKRESFAQQQRQQATARVDPSASPAKEAT